MQLLNAKRSRLMKTFGDRQQNDCYWMERGKDQSKTSGPGHAAQIRKRADEHRCDGCRYNCEYNPGLALSNSVMRVPRQYKQVPGKIHTWTV